MNKKKYLSFILVLMLGLTACKSEENVEGSTKEMITIEVADANGKQVAVEFPKDAERIVALNWSTVDILDSLGLGDRIVGVMKSNTYPSYLESYVNDADIVNVGSMKEPDMEAIMSLEPDIIFSSDRTMSMYGDFSQIAPTMSVYIDYEQGYMESYAQVIKNHAELFGVEEKVNSTIDTYNERIAKIAEFAEGKTALLGLFSEGLNTLGNTGRASIIVNEMGFENLQAEEDVNHGNASSYETWLKLNPDYMFILDKDTAVGSEAISAKEQMEDDNPVIAQSSAYQKQQIIYLEPGNVWYMADAGITALDLMIRNIEEGIGIDE